MKLIASVLAAAACAALTGVAHADTYAWTGDITTSATWTRPDGDTGFYSSFGYDSHYDALQFTVSQSGSYSFLSTSTSINYTGMPWDNYTFLYQNSFTPTMPASLSNIVNANDDIVLGNRVQSGFTENLNAGTTYFFITSGLHRAMYGTYSNTITGPGSVIAAVPEPGTYALMALGLLAVGALARRRADDRSHSSPEGSVG